MHQTRIFPILSVFLLAGISLCQEPLRTIQPDTIYVGADGKYDADPDTAIVSFNIGTQESVLKDAYARAQKASEQIRQTLKSNGIDPKEAQISSFQVAPVYDWKSPKQKLIGYRVSSSITVKLRDFSKIGPIAESFGAMDVTENQSINYTLENIDAAKAKAVEDAFRKAKASAEVVVKAAGRQLAQLIYSSVDTNEMMPPPRPVMAMAKMQGVNGVAPPPTEEFSAQKISITAHINALFGMK
jgi:hypothetical protein